MSVILVHPCHRFQHFVWCYSGSSCLSLLLFSRFQCLLKTSTATLGITTFIPDPGYMSYRIYYFDSVWVNDRVCFYLLLELISANTLKNIHLLIPFTIYIGAKSRKITSVRIKSSILQQPFQCSVGSQRIAQYFIRTLFFCVSTTPASFCPLWLHSPDQQVLRCMLHINKF